MSKVAILLSTYNGDKYLEEQFESILNQSFCDWMLYISDDFSTDNTLKIIKKYRRKYPNKIRLYFGPKKGPAMNYFSLLTNTQINADFYAFCDQDDIWHSEKLSKSMEILRTVNSQIPMLYCGRTMIVDKNGCELGLSKTINYRVSFQNAILECIAGSNTMMFNNATRELVSAIACPEKIVMHDWTTYAAVCSCDGKVIYDDWPSVYYRQHDFNCVGENQSTLSKFIRFKKFLSGDYWRNISNHLESLLSIRQYMTPSSKTTLQKTIECFNGKYRYNFKKIYNIKLYRHNVFETLLIYFSLFFRRGN